MHRTTRLKITDLNQHVICVLCGGYFTDATTIIECLHSFCKTCIVRYLDTSKYCPICDVQVHKTRPHLHIRPDQTLQALVYKLVPGLFKDEMRRRRQFYKEHPQACVSTAASREERGEVGQDEYPIYTDDEKISLCLQHTDTLPPFNAKNEGVQAEKEPDRRHLLCPAAVTVGHLKKFVRLKFDLADVFQVEIFHSDESLDEDYTMMDVAYIYAWRRLEPLTLRYFVYDKTKNSIKLPLLARDAPLTCAQLETPQGRQSNGLVTNSNGMDTNSNGDDGHSNEAIVINSSPEVTSPASIVSKSPKSASKSPKSKKSSKSHKKKSKKKDSEKFTKETPKIPRIRIKPPTPPEGRKEVGEEGMGALSPLSTGVRVLPGGDKVSEASSPPAPKPPKTPVARPPPLPLVSGADVPKTPVARPPPLPLVTGKEAPRPPVARPPPLPLVSGKETPKLPVSRPPLLSVVDRMDVPKRKVGRPKVSLKILNNPQISSRPRVKYTASQGGSAEPTGKRKRGRPRKEPGPPVKSPRLKEAASPSPAWDNSTAEDSGAESDSTVLLSHPPSVVDSPSDGAEPVSMDTDSSGIEGAVNSALQQEEQDGTAPGGELQLTSDTQDSQGSQTPQTVVLDVSQDASCDASQDAVETTEEGAAPDGIEYSTVEVQDSEQGLPHYINGQIIRESVTEQFANLPSQETVVYSLPDSDSQVAPSEGYVNDYSGETDACEMAVDLSTEALVQGEGHFEYTENCQDYCTNTETDTDAECVVNSEVREVIQSHVPDSTSSSPMEEDHVIAGDTVSSASDNTDSLGDNGRSDDTTSSIGTMVAMDTTCAVDSIIGMDDNTSISEDGVSDNTVDRDCGGEPESLELAISQPSPVDSGVVSPGPPDSPSPRREILRATAQTQTSPDHCGGPASPEIRRAAGPPPTPKPGDKLKKAARLDAFLGRIHDKAIKQRQLQLSPGGTPIEGESSPGGGGSPLGGAPAGSPQTPSAQSRGGQLQENNDSRAKAQQAPSSAKPNGPSTPVAHPVGAVRSASHPRLSRAAMPRKADSTQDSNTPIRSLKRLCNGIPSKPAGRCDTPRPPSGSPMPQEGGHRLHLDDMSRLTGVVAQTRMPAPPFRCVGPALPTGVILTNGQNDPPLLPPPPPYPGPSRRDLPRLQGYRAQGARRFPGPHRNPGGQPAPRGPSGPRGPHGPGGVRVRGPSPGRQGPRTLLPHPRRSPYQERPPNPLANGYDAPLELTTKRSRDRKVEQEFQERKSPSGGHKTCLKIPSMVRP